ncbi:uncharacterized protein N7473_007121 [Penicillium subrubescens]|uniref:Fatty acid hydroxylase domain-containing protein n=1 Tax=Penicillium subrubescens TaxID=1316194 RepID=A0A1Q5TGH2_9EURO|nr:uncharacterized protein N7473_007121 [Penicillium subrubescens]KAJ5890893.1 hypothetical protein N7473_007121 [Penicillium subrubescens]OKO99322.1 hypothetical protein PENSUB_8709 [Penicillium subrubescens]
MATPMRNPKDSMKSTWRTWEKSQWKFGHWLLDVLDVHHMNLDQDVPVHDKAEKVPYAPEMQFHRWVLTHAFMPLALHQLYINYFGQPPAWVVFIFYSLCLEFNAVHEVRVLRRLGHKIGFFDGDKHPRDGVPDVGVGKTVQTVLSVIIFRPMVTVFLAYRGDESPASIRWGWLIFETGMYALTLDFWYYIFHRSAHESEHLWKFHRTHHLTKHPNPLLTAYADKVQEFIDVIGTPVITYGTMKLMGFPMGFYEWWVCQQYVVFTEVLGHSGLRMIATAVNPWTSLLKMFDMELLLEDHDLHHRKGWKNSHNYGKQTRVWDRLFRTSIPRVEGHAENIDYVNTVEIPLW